MDDTHEDGTPVVIQRAPAEERRSFLAGKLRELHSHFAARFERFAELFERQTGKGLLGPKFLPRGGNSFCTGREIARFSGHGASFGSAVTGSMSHSLVTPR
jgi:hypothetical protein